MHIRFRPGQNFSEGRPGQMDLALELRGLQMGIAWDKRINFLHPLCSGAVGKPSLAKERREPICGVELNNEGLEVGGDTPPG